MVNVADGANVDMGLIAVKLFLSHWNFLLCISRIGFKVIILKSP